MNKKQLQEICYIYLLITQLSQLENPATKAIFLLLLAFQGKNLYRFLNSKRNEYAFSKNTYYRSLNTSTYN